MGCGFQASNFYRFTPGGILNSEDLIVKTLSNKIQQDFQDLIWPVHPGVHKSGGCKSYTSTIPFVLNDEHGVKSGQVPYTLVTLHNV